VNSNNIYQHDKNAEISYLNSLISSFNPQSGFRGDDAIKRVYARYSELEKKRTSVLNSTIDNVNGYYQLCLKVHNFLYKDILSNAGKIRQSDDPNGGNVYFGGIAQRTMKDKFVGTKPELIKTELDEAFSILFDKKYNYTERSIRFYAEFVAIHPFYDANGRISRYSIDLYLQNHNYYVDWQSINISHCKFLRKLNYCHSVRRRYKQYLSQLNLGTDIHSHKDVYWELVKEKYISYLINFWTKFVLALPDIET
jgi:fido (protein-threonine AMPylation protein)